MLRRSSEGSADWPDYARLPAFARAPRAMSCVCVRASGACFVGGGAAGEGVAPVGVGYSCLPPPSLALKWTSMCTKHSHTTTTTTIFIIATTYTHRAARDVSTENGEKAGQQHKPPRANPGGGPWGGGEETHTHYKHAHTSHTRALAFFG